MIFALLLGVTIAYLRMVFLAYKLLFRVAWWMCAQILGALWHVTVLAWRATRGRNAYLGPTSNTRDKAIPTI